VVQGFRRPFDELRDIRGHLADEFDRASRALEHHAMSSDIESPAPGFYDTQTTNRRILSGKWDEVVRRIRQIEGFEAFLRAVPFASLQSAAAEGPVIVVNVRHVIARFRDLEVMVSQNRHFF
jgi:hypothetical protein